jgi:hypothetical protein
MWSFSTASQVCARSFARSSVAACASSLRRLWLSKICG